MATTTTITHNTATDGRKPMVKDLHEHIVCPLCRGYLIDATTLVECLHSFCRGCIVRRLGSGARACPVCGALTLPPLLPDLALQRLVYLAVPGLYRSELERRRHFRLVNPQCPQPAAPLGALSLTLDDAVSLSLCEIMNDAEDNIRRDDKIPISTSSASSSSTTNSKKNLLYNRRRERGTDKLEGEEEEEEEEEDGEGEESNGNSSSSASSSKRLIRYLKCPAGVTVRHLVRLLALKRGWGDTDGKFTLKNIEMLYQNNTNSSDDDGLYGSKNDMHKLQLSWTLLDLACIFKWDKETPMKLFYRVVKREEPILQPPGISTYNMGCSNNNNNNNNNSSIVSGNSTNHHMENVQRPPTPPPSPKQSNNSEIRTQSAALQQHSSKPRSKPDCNQESIKIGVNEIEKPKLADESAAIETEKCESNSSSSTVAISSLVTSAQVKTCNHESLMNVNNSEMHNNTSSSGGESLHGIKVKKPRCEVTPVMRAPGLHGSSSPAGVAIAATTGIPPPGVQENNNRTKVPRMEHHKRRKRRNKRLIAEITTTPREDLLKLKVRLTPCPPRITSSTGGTAKEKLLQMRAVRREKIKNNNERNETPPPSPAPAPASASASASASSAPSSSSPSSFSSSSSSSFSSSSSSSPCSTNVVDIVNNSHEMPLTPPLSASADNINAMPNLTVVKTDEKSSVVVPKIQKIKEVVAITATVELHEDQTIEEIIDGIPDEVVRVAQNMNNPASSAVKPQQTVNEEKKVKIKAVELQNKKKEDFVNQNVKTKKNNNNINKRIPEVEIISELEEEELELLEDQVIEELDDELEFPSASAAVAIKEDRKSLPNMNKPVSLGGKKDEEVLRRLGLVAISEASKTLQDKIRNSQKTGANGSGGIDYNRETLERQLRESKANRVRSLLAEKQMRDALKSIMSKSGSKTSCKGSGLNGPKKGPPPLAPLTPKQGFPNPPKSSHPVNHPQISSQRSSASTGKIEIPLDLSSGANNALDLSPATPSSSSGNINPPIITSTTFSGPIKSSRGKTTPVLQGGTVVQSSGKLLLTDEKKNQDNLNLRTLSEAAVSLLGTGINPTSGGTGGGGGGGGGGGEIRITNSTILSNKVALRIPQPHNRISGFGNGMKIKPNLAVRHIPNPQAFVASQYVRNQRTNFFNAQQQQPP